MRQHAGVFAANFSSNLLWQNCFAPKKSASCAEPRRVAAGILDVCQGGATTGLRETRLLRRMFSYARRPKRPAFVCGEGCRSREGQKPLPNGKKRIPAPVCTPRALASRRALARNDSAPRWERRDTWIPPYGVRRSSKAGRVVRPYNGTSRTPSPTHSVIARSEATRQSVLPSPKMRIPAPVTRSLVRNNSAPRWERRDTWVPPYGVRRSFRADRVVRPYKAKQEPRKTGRRGRRPLRNHKGCVQWADRVVRPYKAEQEPCKTGRRGRRALRIDAGR